MSLVAPSKVKDMGFAGSFRYIVVSQLKDFSRSLPFAVQIMAVSEVKAVGWGRIWAQGTLPC